MTTKPHVLLLDDGELDDVVAILESLELPYTRQRGGEIGSDIAPPTGLLIATPRRAQVVRRGSPANAMPGRPVRIIVVEEDSNSMRRMLRQMGFHLLVRRPTHPEIWRLLIRRAAYQGAERRLDTRVTAGSGVTLSGSGLQGSALLVDISNRGCRLLLREEVPRGTPLSISIPDSENKNRALILEGSILRVRSASGTRGDDRYSAVMLFDEAMPSTSQHQLVRLLNRWSTGPSSFSNQDDDPWMLPTWPANERHPVGLDNETDPAIRANAGVDLEIASERRRGQRGVFADAVIATSDNHESRVLLGCDLSAGGMRIERLPNVKLGDRFRLALYGPEHAEAFVVHASVVRDDGEDGFALRFEKVPESTAVELEKLVACLPDVESLEKGETAGLGSVISEILSETDE
jgi:hypothetical protein